MAYNLAIGDVIEVSFEQLLYGQRLLNIRHYVVTTISTPQFANLDFDGWETSITGVGGITDKMKALASVDWSITGVVFQRIRPTRNARYRIPENIVGSSPTQAKTPNVAATIYLTTDFATVHGGPFPRGQVSNWHQGGIPVDAYDGGVVLGALSTQLNQLGTQLALPLVNGNGNEMSPVVYHRKAPTIDESHDPIINHASNPYVRVMRRRTVGLGI